MKKLILSLLAVTVFATSGIVQADEADAGVGLIDMAHVFQNYKKFEELRAGLQTEIEQSDAQAKEMVERMQKLQEELKRFESGSPEYEKAEKAVLQAKSDFEAFRASMQRKLARRESEMFKIIYADVTAAVTKYAEYKKYSVVLRFNRRGVDDSTSPAEAVQTMNKTVIYFQPNNDITDVVLGYLNRPYNGTPATTTGQTRTSRN